MVFRSLNCVLGPPFEINISRTICLVVQPPPHAGTVEVQSPQACLRPNLDGVWVVDKESLRVSDGFYDAFTRNFVE